MVMWLIIYAGVYLGFAVRDTVWQLAMLFACYGVYAALTEGVAKAWVADLVPKDVERGTWPGPVRSRDEPGVAGGQYGCRASLDGDRRQRRRFLRRHVRYQ